jgi:hypothetical protein
VSIRGGAEVPGGAGTGPVWYSSRSTAAGTRYRQLETVPQFGSEKLDRAGETGQLSARMAHTSSPSPLPITP